MLVLLTAMSFALAASSFLAGLLPLSFAFAKNTLERLSCLGTGLLLGTALGVIIPEGLEAVVTDYSKVPSAGDAHQEFPITRISLSLLFGFTLMLVIEQLVSPHVHTSYSNDVTLHSVRKDPSYVEFEANLDDPEQGSSSNDCRGLPKSTLSSLTQESLASPPNRAIPLTLGLFVHGLADGLALGASALAPEAPNAASHLSLIVFLALIIHKVPTSLALTTSFIATSLPRAKCKKYLAIFSSSTPLGAMISYLAFVFFGQGDSSWTGTALLISGGSFLYVATVLQPVSETTVCSNHELQPGIRVFHIILGICIPFLLSSLLGHGH